MTGPAIDSPLVSGAREELARFAVSEPAWLAERRRAALATFATTRMPDPLQDEEWRRMTLAGLDLDGRPAGVKESFLLDAGDLAALPQGAIVMPLAEAARRHPALVQKHLGQVVPDARGKFEALSLALHESGAFVYVPADATIERTILLRSRAEARPGAAGGFAAARRSLVVLERNARATIVSVGESSDEPGVVTSAVEVVLGEGAALRHATVQVHGAKTWAFETRRAVVAKDARVEWGSCDLGARVARTTVESVLAEPGGRAEARSMVFADGKQHVDLGVRMVHVAKDTEGDMVVRAALAGHARCVYRGHVEIKRGAKGTNNQQKEAVLLLSSEARSDAIPSLFIDENDVKAGHGATAGRVDERQLFYLMSRGLRRRTAEKLVVLGFFAPLTERITIPELQDEVMRRIEQKLGE